MGGGAEVVNRECGGGSQSASGLRQQQLPSTIVSTICRETRETQTPKPASTAARVDTVGITRYFTLKCYVSSVHGNVHRQRFFLATGLVHTTLLRIQGKKSPILSAMFVIMLNLQLKLTF